MTVDQLKSSAAAVTTTQSAMNGDPGGEADPHAAGKEGDPHPAEKDDPHSAEESDPHSPAQGLPPDEKKDTHPAERAEKDSHPVEKNPHQVGKDSHLEVKESNLVEDSHPAEDSLPVENKTRENGEKSESPETMAETASATPEVQESSSNADLKHPEDIQHLKNVQLPDEISQPTAMQSPELSIKSTSEHSDLSQDKINNLNPKTAPPSESSRISYTWTSLPSQKVSTSSGGDDENHPLLHFRCDLCYCHDVFKNESELKLHQIKLHINPHYLSNGDRDFCKVTNFLVNNSTQFSPDLINFNGLFRCHVCFIVWNSRDELRIHLFEHEGNRPSSKDEESNHKIVQNGHYVNSNEDFEEVPLKSSSRKGRKRKATSFFHDKENDVKIRRRLDRKSKPKKFFELDEIADEFISNESELEQQHSRIRNHRTKSNNNSDQRKQPNSSSNNNSGNGNTSNNNSGNSSDRRPERKCKNTTKSLVAISLTDGCHEQYDLQHYENRLSSKNSENDGTENIDNNKNNEIATSQNDTSKVDVDSNNVVKNSKPIDTAAVKSVISVKDAESVANSKSDDVIKSADAIYLESSLESSVSKVESKLSDVKNESTKPVKKSVSNSSKDNKKVQTNKKQNLVKKKSNMKATKSVSNKKTANLKKGKNVKSKLAKKKKGANNKIAKKSGKSNSVQQKSREQSTKSNKSSQKPSIEKIFSDLKPKAKRIPETEKSLSVIKSVVEFDKPFICLKCGETFPDFKHLSQHKLNECSKLSKPELRTENKDKIDTVNADLDKEKVSDKQTNVSDTLSVSNPSTENEKEILDKPNGILDALSLSNLSTQNKNEVSIKQNNTSDTLPVSTLSSENNDISMKQNNILDTPSVSNPLTENESEVLDTVLMPNSMVKASKSDIFSKLLVPNPSVKPIARRFQEPCDENYTQYVSSAIRVVPECTFNNMHGKIEHVASSDGVQFQKNPNLGAVEKVKLNISGNWSTKDVWESGWEIGKDHLTWQKYENSQSESRKFLQNMSHLPWEEQKAFKKIYDNSFFCRHRSKKSSSQNSSQPSTTNPSISTPNASTSNATTSDSASESPMKQKKSLLPQSLDLKQMNKSVKYLSQAEREKLIKAAKRRSTIAAKKAAAAAAAKGTETSTGNNTGTTPATPAPVKTNINGEWELCHRYMCSVCSKVFDEQQDVLEHKWDMHPFVIVSHITMQDKLRLPPSNMQIYPQLGRHLKQVDPLAPPTMATTATTAATATTASPKNKKPRKSSPSTSTSSSASPKTFLCSKCSTVFESKDLFYTHILVCGGDEYWDVTKKKPKNRSRKKLGHGGGLKSVVMRMKQGRGNTKGSGNGSRDGTDTEDSLSSKAKPRVKKTPSKTNKPKSEKPFDPKSPGRLTRARIALIEESKNPKSKKKGTGRGKKTKPEEPSKESTNAPPISEEKLPKTEKDETSTLNGVVKKSGSSGRRVSLSDYLLPERPRRSAGNYSRETNSTVKEIWETINKSELDDNKADLNKSELDKVGVENGDEPVKAVSSGVETSMVPQESTKKASKIRQNMAKIRKSSPKKTSKIPQDSIQDSLTFPQDSPIKVVTVKTELDVDDITDHENIVTADISDTIAAEKSDEKKDVGEQKIEKMTSSQGKEAVEKSSLVSTEVQPILGRRNTRTKDPDLKTPEKQSPLNNDNIQTNDVLAEVADSSSPRGRSAKSKAVNRLRKSFETRFGRDSSNDSEDNEPLARRRLQLNAAIKAVGSDLHRTFPLVVDKEISEVNEPVTKEVGENEPLLKRRVHLNATENEDESPKVDYAKKMKEDKPFAKRRVRVNATKKNESSKVNDAKEAIEDEPLAKRRVRVNSTRKEEESKVNYAKEFREKEPLSKRRVQFKPIKKDDESPNVNNAGELREDEPLSRRKGQQDPAKSVVDDSASEQPVKRKGRLNVSKKRKRASNANELKNDIVAAENVDAEKELTTNDKDEEEPLARRVQLNAAKDKDEEPLSRRRFHMNSIKSASEDNEILSKRKGHLSPSKKRKKTEKQSPLKKNNIEKKEVKSCRKMKDSGKNQKHETVESLKSESPEGSLKINIGQLRKQKEAEENRKNGILGTLRTGEKEDDSQSDSSEICLSRRRSATARRRNSADQIMALNAGRVYFPVEVKLSAVERIENGESKAQVARDLQCPLSTVSTWWKKRKFIAERYHSGQSDNGSGASGMSTPVSVMSEEEEEVPGKAVQDKNLEKGAEKQNGVNSEENKEEEESPSKRGMYLNRKALFRSMKQRVETAFKTKDDLPAQIEHEEENGANENGLDDSSEKSSSNFDDINDENSLSSVGSFQDAFTPSIHSSTEDNSCDDDLGLVGGPSGGKAGKRKKMINVIEVKSGKNTSEDLFDQLIEGNNKNNKVSREDESKSLQTQDKKKLKKDIYDFTDGESNDDESSLEGTETETESESEVTFSPTSTAIVRSLMLKAMENAFNIVEEKERKKTDKGVDKNLSRSDTLQSISSSNNDVDSNSMTLDHEISYGGFNSNSDMSRSNSVLSGPETEMPLPDPPEVTSPEPEVVNADNAKEDADLTSASSALLKGDKDCVQKDNNEVPHSRTTKDDLPPSRTSSGLSMIISNYYNDDDDDDDLDEEMDVDS